MKKNRSISLYIVENIDFQNGEVIKHPVIVDINESGYLFFQIEKLSFVDTPFLEYLTKNIVSKVTNRIIKLFDPTRSIFVDFDSFKDEFIDILEIEYMVHVSDKQSNMSFNNLHPFKSLLYKIKTNDQIIFQYSRVSNYNKMTQIQSFIVEQFNNQSHYDDIRQQVSTQFNYSYEETENIIEDVIKLIDTDDHLNKSNTNVRKLKKIKSNGGFHVELEYDEEKSRYYIIIKSINHIDYLHSLRVFITNFIVCCRNEVAKEVVNKYFEKSITKKVDENIIAEKVQKSNEEMKRTIEELTTTDVVMEEDNFDDLSNINDENALNILQESFGNENNGDVNENEIIMNSKNEEQNIIQSQQENNSNSIKVNNQKGNQNNGDVQEENRVNGNQQTGNGENLQKSQTIATQNNGSFNESNMVSNNEGSIEENGNAQEEQTPIAQNRNRQNGNANNEEKTSVVQNNGNFSESNMLSNEEDDFQENEEGNGNVKKVNNQNDNAQEEQTPIAQNEGSFNESNMLSNSENENNGNDEENNANGNAQDEETPIAQNEGSFNESNMVSNNEESVEENGNVQNGNQQPKDIEQNVENPESSNDVNILPMKKTLTIMIYYPIMKVSVEQVIILMSRYQIQKYFSMMRKA